MLVQLVKFENKIVISDRRDFLYKSGSDKSGVQIRGVLLYCKTINSPCKVKH